MKNSTIQAVLSLSVVLLIACGGGGANVSGPEIKTLESQSVVISSQTRSVSLTNNRFNFEVASSAPIGESIEVRAQDFTDYFPKEETRVSNVSFEVSTPLPLDATAEVGKITIPLTTEQLDFQSSVWCYYTQGSYGIPIESSVDRVARTATLNLQKGMFSITAFGATRGSPSGVGRFSFVLTPKMSAEMAAVELYVWNSSIRNWRALSQNEQFVPDTRIAVIAHGMSNDIFEKNALATYLLQSGKYDSVIGVNYNWRADIMANAAQLGLQIRQRHSHGVRLDLFGHSMGGLLLRSLTDSVLPDPGSYGVERLFTLGTPHQGVPLQGMRYWMGATSVNWFDSEGVRNLMENSLFMKQLRERPGSSAIEYNFLAGNNFEDYGLKGKAINRIYDGAFEHDGIVPVSSAYASNLPSYPAGRRRISRITKYSLGHKNIGGEMIDSLFSLDKSVDFRFLKIVRATSGVGVNIK